MPPAGEAEVGDDAVAEMAKFEGQVKVETGWSKLRAGLLALLCGGAAVAAAWAAGLAPPILAVLLFFAVFLGGLALGRRLRTEKEQKLVVDRDGLQVGGRARVPRAKILQAVVHPKRPDTLLVRQQRYQLELQLADEVALQRALEALDPDGEEDVGEERAFELGRRGTWSLVAGICSLTISLQLLAPAPAAGAVGLALGLGLCGYWWLSGRASLHVGSDGVAISEGFRKRYFAYRDLVGVEADPAHDQHVTGKTSWSYLVLTTRDGKETRVAVQQPYLKGERPGRAEALARRIERARLAYETADAPDVSALRRGDRSAAQWLAALRHLAGQRDYRQGALGDEQLSALANSPGAATTERAGAAVLLRLRTPQQKLRIAVDEVADPALREALATAEATAAEEKLLAALADVVDP